MNNTNFLVSSVGLDVLKKSGQHTSVVCCSGFSNNSLKYSQFKLWVHKRYSGIINRLVADTIYVCLSYDGKARPLNGRPVTEMNVDGTMLDVLLWHAVLQWGLRHSNCRQTLSGMRKVLETLACPHHQAPLTWVARQGVCDLHPPSYAVQ